MSNVSGASIVTTNSRGAYLASRRTGSIDMPVKPVITFLTPGERQRVDAAGEGCYTTVHRESIDDVFADLRSQQVSAVLVSVLRYQQQHAAHVARLVREFPRVPAVALLTATEARTTQSVLSLGQQGIQAIVDVRDPSGWRDLRHFVTREEAGSIEQAAIECIRDTLPDATDDALRFLDGLFLAPRSMTTVRQLARQLGVVPTTFMSRFFRARLPAPKRYLAAARLVRAARLFENPGHSITHVAFLLEYSSPQSFSRHVQHVMHCGAAEFRRRYDGFAMLEHLCTELLEPHRDIFRTFTPFTAMPQWIGR